MSIISSRILQCLLINTWYNSLKYTMEACQTIDSKIKNESNKKSELLVGGKHRTRYDGRVKKRQWEDRRGDTDGGGQAKRECGEPFERVKRKKIAMLLGYSGVNYFGMQRNPGIETVEEDLIKALQKADYITDEAFKQMQTIQFQRASRTDKGVSAAKQVVSLKLPVEAKVEAINEHLPECIRVFGLKRVTKGFNCKTQCDFRTYTYTMPSFALDETVDVQNDSRKAYRATPEKLELLQSVLSHYEGSKNYHNFTSGKDYKDPSSSRFMVSFDVDKIFVSNDVEFIVLKVKGQSFMIHQIRKMVGLSLAVTRGNTDLTTMERAFSSTRIDLPMAPSLGLVLDQVHYDRYDKRYGGDNMHDTLSWDELNDEVEAFKEKYIYPNIIDTELEENVMADWLGSLSYHTYDVRLDEGEHRSKNREKDDKSEVTEGSSEAQGNGDSG